MPYPTTDPTSDERIAYDLRQIYAKIVGEHIIDVAYYRKEKNYPKYFEALEDLYICTKHNFKPYKKNKKGKTTTYNSLKQIFIEIANKNTQAYLGNSNDAKELAEIKNALNNIEIHLWFKIKEAKMIGVKDSEEGLL